MKIFKFKNWQLIVSEEAWGLLPFKKLLDRDKTEGKAVAHAEMLFIWYWCDVKSNYTVMDEKDRLRELKNDVAGIPKGWKKDKVMDEAIAFYMKFETVIQRLHRQSLVSAHECGNYLENTKALLEERDNSGRPVMKIGDITKGLKDVKIIIKELKITEQEVIKEMENNDAKKKGSKSFNLFEDGFKV